VVLTQGETNVNTTEQDYIGNVSEFIDRELSPLNPAAILAEIEGHIVDATFLACAIAETYPTAKAELCHHLSQAQKIQQTWERNLQAGPA
jgi:MarR-like DNA-binding transcriptional regulator SgrR of sgrS sRNA